jgi:hypothetical protein
MNLVWVDRIIRRRSSRFKGRLLRIWGRGVMGRGRDTDTSNINSNRRKCNVSMVDHTETAVLVLLLTMGSWGWNRGPGKREHTQWLKDGMAACLEGGTVTLDPCLYHLSKHLIYRLKANIQDTIPATPNLRLRLSRLHLLITMYSHSGEWVAWRTGTTV